MGRIQTPITGITTSSTYEDGTAYSLVNLRPKNGALHPVAPRKVIQELSQKYDIVFVHQNNDYKNWIGVVNSNGYSSVYWDVRDEQPQSIASYIQGTINSVQQIGNTLSLITEDNIYYLFYQNNKYTFLGEIPQVPVISLNTSDVMSHAEYYFVNEYGSGTIKPDNFIDATKGLVNKAIDVLVNGGTNSNGEPIGGFGLYLFDACFIRYAYRLYDGSITKHSPPILVMPVKDILELKTIDYKFVGGSLVNDSKVDVYGYRIYMHYDFTQLGNDSFDKWKDIIKSVDIFLSPPVGISNVEKIRKDMSTTDLPPIFPFPMRHYNLIKELTPEALKNVANTSNLYHVRSIDLGTQATWDADMLPSKDEDFSTMENLIYQELMTDDNFSNHKYGASRSYVYNNRLHLGSLKTTFFKGFHAGYFRWSNDYNATTPPEGEANYIVSEVEIYTGTSLEKVYSFYSMSYEAFSVGKLFTSAFLSYPDTRAKRMTFYEVNNGVWTKVFSTLLEPHNLLNLAYFINDGLKPIIGIDDPTPVPAPDTSKDVTQSEPNKIKVSELNNPLSFPNLNTYQAGNGTILAMATNAMNVSDRNYGQYPLYIFTTQGIWTLNVGEGEVVYSSQTAPTYTEAPTTDIVCSTPFGVVFTTQRGLQIINGQSVDFLSLQLEQPFKRMEEETNPQIEELLHKFEKQRFSDYLKGLKNIIYNSYENELIINNPTSSFNYVLGLYNRQFYQSTEKISNDVKNIFPELIVIDRNNLKDYSEIETTRTHFSLMLRPLTFGNELTKWFSNLKIPFTLYDVERMFVGVYASADGVRFVGRHGNFYGEMDRAVAYNTKTMASNNGRYFLVALAAIASCESDLDIIDPEVSVKYNNM